ncbi:WbqC family protein [Yokenella regensburgei]|uniref:WbqC family protein n=1 Tax=Yokenella regensburgei TaxID=158877 RepID=UPI003F138426
MKIAIMQPYFFPYLGYISLIKHTERFILLDDVQFIRHGWIERNRILKPESGWQYLSVPLKKKNHTATIKETEINNETDWRDKLLRQLTHYKKKASFFRKTMAVVEQGLDIRTDSIAELNLHVLKSVCGYLEINADLSVFSHLNMDIEPPDAPDEWALNICKKIPTVSAYWNPTGGMTFFDKNKYTAANIDLVFQKVNLTPYSQSNQGLAFEPGLSIIDVMMFNSPDAIHTMLDNYEKL